MTRKLVQASATCVSNNISTRVPKSDVDIDMTEIFLELEFRGLQSAGGDLSALREAQSFGPIIILIDPPSKEN